MALGCSWSNFAFGHVSLTKLGRDCLLVDRNIDDGKRKDSMEEDGLTGLRRLIIRNLVMRS